VTITLSVHGADAQRPVVVIDLTDKVLRVVDTGALVSGVRPAHT
jgi:hypothetical protein